jgi:hypothetical protein
MKTTIYKYTHAAIDRFGSDMEGAPGAERMQCAAVAATRAHHRMRTYSRSISMHTDAAYVTRPSSIIYVAGTPQGPDTYTFFHFYTCIETCLCAAIPKQVDARASECLYAASETGRARPGRLRWRDAGPEAAHTLANVVTDAVFHAPMFALNADPEEVSE